MRRFLVRSSAIRSLGYDQKLLRLDVEYPSGEIYRYEGVPPEEVVQMMRSESLGRFINFRIKPRYRFMKLDH